MARPSRRIDRQSKVALFGGRPGPFALLEFLPALQVFGCRQLDQAAFMNALGGEKFPEKTKVAGLDVPGSVQIDQVKDANFRNEPCDGGEFAVAARLDVQTIPPEASY